MKKIVSLVLVVIMLLMPFGVNAIEISIDVYDYGDTGNDNFYGVAMTSDGGWVAVGYTDANIGDMETHGGQDGIIVKYDKDGNVEWQQTYGGTASTEQFWDVIVTSDGSYVVVGYVNSGAQALTKGKIDGVIVKYNSSGEVVWQHSYGGTSSDYFHAVTETSDGGYVAVGYTKGSIEGIDYHAGQDAIIVKYDKDGNIEWQKDYGGASSDRAYAVAETNDGGIVMAGMSSSTDIEDLDNHGSTDAYIVKYSAKGELEWQADYGGSQADYFYGITATSDGGCVAVGYGISEDIEDLDNHGSNDAYIVKYNADGELEWQQSYGGSKGDYFNGVSETLKGGYLVLGWVYSTDIEGLTSYSEESHADAVIVYFDENGNMVWQESRGGSKNDVIWRVATDGAGNYVAVGYSKSDIEGTTNHGNYDAIIIRLSCQYEATKSDEDDINYEITVENNRGKITLNSVSGYTLDSISIVDTDGNSVSYYEEDGYYYFNLTDDVVVSVTFKEESTDDEETMTNPSTYDNILIYVIALLGSLIIISTTWHLVKKKQN